jgi:hypothetical protein
VLQKENALRLAEATYVARNSASFVNWRLCRSRTP